MDRSVKNSWSKGDRRKKGMSKSIIDLAELIPIQMSKGLVSPLDKLQVIDLTIKYVKHLQAHAGIAGGITNGFGRNVSSNSNGSSEHDTSRKAITTSNSNGTSDLKSHEAAHVISKNINGNNNNSNGGAVVNESPANHNNNNNISPDSNQQQVSPGVCCEFMRLSEEERRKEYKTGFNDSIRESISFIRKSDIDQVIMDDFTYKLVNHLLKLLEDTNDLKDKDKQVTGGQYCRARAAGRGTCETKDAMTQTQNMIKWQQLFPSPIQQPNSSTDNGLKGSMKAGTMTEVAKPLLASNNGNITTRTSVPDVMRSISCASIIANKTLIQNPLSHHHHQHHHHPLVKQMIPIVPAPSAGPQAVRGGETPLRLIRIKSSPGSSTTTSSSTEDVRMITPSSSSSSTPSTGRNVPHPPPYSTSAVVSPVRSAATAVPVTSTAVAPTAGRSPTGVPAAAAAGPLVSQRSSFREPHRVVPSVANDSGERKEKQDPSPAAAASHQHHPHVPVVAIQSSPCSTSSPVTSAAASQQNPLLHQHQQQQPAPSPGISDMHSVKDQTIGESGLPAATAAAPQILVRERDLHHPLKVNDHHQVSPVGRLQVQQQHQQVSQVSFVSPAKSTPPAASPDPPPAKQLSALQTLLTKKTSSSSQQQQTPTIASVVAATCSVVTATPVASGVASSASVIQRMGPVSKTLAAAIAAAAASDQEESRNSSLISSISSPNSEEYNHKKRKESPSCDNGSSGGSFKKRFLQRFDHEVTAEKVTAAPVPESNHSNNSNHAISNPVNYQETVRPQEYEVQTASRCSPENSSTQSGAPVPVSPPPPPPPPPQAVTIVSPRPVAKAAAAQVTRAIPTSTTGQRVMLSSEQRSCKLKQLADRLIPGRGDPSSSNYVSPLKAQLMQKSTTAYKAILPAPGHQMQQNQVKYQLVEHPRVYFNQGSRVTGNITTLQSSGDMPTPYHHQQHPVVQSVPQSKQSSAARPNCSCTSERCDSSNIVRQSPHDLIPSSATYHHTSHDLHHQPNPHVQHQQVNHHYYQQRPYLSRHVAHQQQQDQPPPARQSPSSSSLPHGQQQQQQYQLYHQSASLRQQNSMLNRMLSHGSDGSSNGQQHHKSISSSPPSLTPVLSSTAAAAANASSSSQPSHIVVRRNATSVPCEHQHQQQHEPVRMTTPTTADNRTSPQTHQQQPHQQSPQSVSSYPTPPALATDQNHTSILMTTTPTTPCNQGHHKISPPPPFKHHHENSDHAVVATRETPDRVHQFIYQQSVPTNHPSASQQFLQYPHVVRSPVVWSVDHQHEHQVTMVRNGVHQQQLYERVSPASSPMPASVSESRQQQHQQQSQSQQKSFDVRSYRYHPHVELPPAVPGTYPQQQHHRHLPTAAAATTDDEGFLQQSLTHQQRDHHHHHHHQQQLHHHPYFMAMTGGHRTATTKNPHQNQNRPLIQID